MNVNNEVNEFLNDEVYESEWWSEWILNDEENEYE